MKVVVDGIDFVPAAPRPRIAAAITTRNRPQVLAETLAAFAALSPEIPVIVVDDGSETPVTVPDGVTVVRHDTSLGVPAAKNRCLAELMKLGAEHLFLFDDDTRPASQQWYRPYVESAEPHLQHSWTHSGTDKPVPKMDVLYRDDRLVGYRWSMGCMMYVTAEVVRRVGGMRPEFGRGMEEHGEWSQRIHNACYTTFVHQDVPDSTELIWAADRHGAVARSLPDQDRAALQARNERLRLALRTDTSFVPYTDRDVIICAYFTSQGDPQRGNKKPVNDGAALQALTASVTGHELVVLSDSLPDSHRVPVALCAYTQRWISYRQYLRDHPDIRYAWLVDATDVTLLNNPFPQMVPGTLYCGWEPEVLGCNWIRAHSPNYGDWVDRHSQEMLLNCGVVGGDRMTLMKLCQSMTELWADGDHSDPLEEMTLFNIAARRQRWVTGIQVTTVFKTHTQQHPTAWFAHK